MGFFYPSGSTSGVSSSGPRYTPTPYTAPSPQAGGSSGYGSFPQTIDVPYDTATQALSFAAKAPGYVYERPLAAAQSLGNFVAPGSNIVSNVENFVGGIPGVGAAIGGVGNVLDWFSKLGPQAINYSTANGLLQTNGLPDTTPVIHQASGWHVVTDPNAAAALAGGAVQTLGQLRADAYRRGFTPQDVTDMQNGAKSPLDFPDRAIADNRLVDLAGRLITDPTNLLIGAGALGLGSKAARLTEAIRGSEEVAKVADLSVPALNAMDGAAALRAGTAAGVTLDGLSTALRTIGRGVSQFGSAYRKVAVGTTIGQLGVEAVDRALPDNSPLRAPFEGLFQIANDMEHQTPLSNSSLFNLYSAFHFPIHDVAGAVTDKAKGAWYDRVTSSKILPSLIDQWNPGSRATSAARLAEVKTWFGGEQAFTDFLGHLYSRAVLGMAPMPALIDRAVGSLQEAMAHTANVQKLVQELSRQAGRDGRIGWRQLAEEARNWDMHGRSVTELSKGVSWPTFDPRRMGSTWTEWQALSAQLSKIFGETAPVVVGIMDGLLPSEHLKAARVMFEQAAKVGKDGHRWVSPEDARAILGKYPSLYSSKHDYDSTFRRLIPKDAVPVELGKITQRLDRLEKTAPTMREYLYPFERWASRAEKLKQQRGSVLDSNGQVDMARVPETGGAHVFAPTLRNTARTNTGFPASSVDHVRELRGTSEVQTFENAVPFALDEAGYNVRAVTQGIVAPDQGSLTPAIDVYLDEAHPDPNAALQAAASILKATGKTSGAADTATVVFSGKEVLDAAGLQPNGTLFRFDVGGLTPEQRQILSDSLPGFSGHAFLNDTAGVMQIAYRLSDYDQHAGQYLVSQLEQKLGRSPSREPAWVQIVGHDQPRGITRARRIEGVAPDATTTGLDHAYGADPRYIAANNFLSDRAGYVKSGGLAERPAEPVGTQPAGPAGAGEAVSPSVGEQPAAVAPSSATRLAEIEAELADLKHQHDLVMRSAMGQSVPARVEELKARERVIFAQQSKLIAERKVLEQAAEAAAAEPIRQRIDAAVPHANEGQVLFLAEKDAETGALIPKFDPEVEATLPPNQLAKISDLAMEIRQFHPAYTLKVTPHGGTPYYLGQGNAILDEVLGRQALGDSLTYGVWSKVDQAWNAMFGKVYSKTLNAGMKQAFYNELLPKGATVEEVNGYLRAIEDAARHTYLLGNIRSVRRGDMLPSQKLNEIAAGVGTDFGGFKPETLSAIGPDFYRVMDRAGSRFFRGLDEHTRGKGQLGHLIQQWYGTEKGALTGTGRVYAASAHIVRSWYHVFRFMLDPRWHAMNALEADILGFAKYGREATRFTGAKQATMDSASRVHSGGKIGAEVALRHDEYASGWLDSRNLEGYIGRSFRVDRVRSTLETLRTMSEEDPSIIALRQKFGGGPEEWVAGLEKMMYEFDTKGVRQTVLDEARAQLDTQEYADMQPLIQQLYQRNQRIYEDVVNTFHGNVNRSNMERIGNSYFLYWPLSYQLKAAKWLFTVLTKQAFGRETNLAGAWTIDRLVQQHNDRLRHDPAYAQMFEGNPDIWRTAAMLLPITPFDLGVSLSKITSYSSSALAAALGLGVYPKNYPQDPINAALRMTAIGPSYTQELLTRIMAESKDRK